MKTQNQQNTQNPKYNTMIEFDSSQSDTITIRKEYEKAQIRKQSENRKNDNYSKTPFL